MSFRSVINLSFNPRLAYITSARNLVGQFFREHVRDEDALDRCLVTAHELIENIVKYSVDGREVSIEAETIQLSPDQLLLRIRTRNEAAPEHAAEVVARLRALTEATDPNAHYDRLIVETAPRTKGSGLGLARIRAEAEMTITYEVENNQVTIVAESRLATKGSK